MKYLLLILLFPACETITPIKTDTALANLNGQGEALTRIWKEIKKIHEEAFDEYSRSAEHSRDERLLMEGKVKMLLQIETMMADDLQNWQTKANSLQP